LGFPYDCCKSKKSVSQEDQDPAENRNGDPNAFDTAYIAPDNFEAPPREILQQEQQGRILKVSNLRKKYDNGFKAVNGMNIKMYSDQIFVLLGHNGAGKTTTISMLTGLLEATEGEAQVFGVDMFNEMNTVRKFMGVCPQHDVLFELLSVEEHLQVFYDLKGGDQNPAVKKAEIEKLLVDFGIDDKRNALAFTLSGGNKRKLSVAISLCGNSKFVLLDEPTSGMDLQARRQLWNQLKLYKKDRIIVLTTHYMDEADILGDRIGIMTRGKMTCLGTSIFLKNKFGVGYNLTVVKTIHEKNPILMDYL
jgi:ATP-binding cassette, subfamily A (ABC1), member 3